jgi:ribose transport system permease protein
MNEINVNNKVKLSKFKAVSQNYRSELGVGVALLFFFIVIAIIAPNFVSGTNLTNVMSQISIIGILAIGQHFVIITGGIDLSVGNLLGLSSMMMALVMSTTQNMFLGIIAAFATGAVVGFINGALISLVGLPPFIATLGLMTISRSVDYLICNGRAITNLVPGFGDITSASVVGAIRIYYVAIIILFFVMSWVLSNTKFGRYLYAIGSNENAARIAGVNTRKTKIMAYVTSGLMAALGGILLASKLESVDPNYGVNYEMDTIAAVVIGGGLMTGGKGTILGTAIGVIFMGIIKNGLDIIGVSPYWQGFAVGIIIILALIIERVTNIKQKN